MNMGVEMSNLNFLKRKRKGVTIEPMNVSKSVDEQNYVCELVWYVRSKERWRN
jgi:hypothetical protein